MYNVCMIGARGAKVKYWLQPHTPIHNLLLPNKHIVFRSPTATVNKPHTQYTLRPGVLGITMQMCAADLQCSQQAGRIGGREDGRREDGRVR